MAETNKEGFEMITRAELLAAYPNLPEETLRLNEKLLDSKTIQGDREQAEKGQKNASGGRKKAHPHQDFIDRIVKVAHLYGWKVVYFRTARTKDGWATPVGADGKGFPDLFLTRLRDPEEWERPYLGDYKISEYLFWEVKIPPDKVSPEQEAWINLLDTARVVTPADWDWIVETLK